MPTDSVSLTSARRVASHLADLLFPTVCAACDRLGPVICDDCLSRMQPVPDRICERCGRLSEERSTICANCWLSETTLHQSRTVFFYQEPLATLIHRLKYDGLFALALPLGQQMALRWPVWWNSPDVIMPVPLHPRRQRSRGFNQALLLAQHVARAVGLKVDQRSLKRIRHTPPQVGLSPVDRQANVRDAFSVQGSAVQRQHIVLVDDVYTTGATMTAAANALQRAGAASVVSYCLARAGQ